MTMSVDRAPESCDVQPEASQYVITVLYECITYACTRRHYKTYRN